MPAAARLVPAAGAMLRILTEQSEDGRLAEP
jgi:hypothetical protein